MSPDDLRNLSDVLFWTSLISGAIGGFLAVFAVGMIRAFWDMRLDQINADELKEGN